jgi:hypothetical protein
MPPVVGKPIGTILTSLSLVVAVCSASWPSPSAAADDAFIRASAGILMSRNMSTKDRVEAADSLARYEPRAAVPILIDALNETSEPVRRAAAARAVDDRAERKSRGDRRGSQAIPALRVALGDAELYGSNERRERPRAPGRTRRPPWRMCAASALRIRPVAYERFLAARGLIGLDPAATLTPYVLEWLLDEPQARHHAEQHRRTRQHRIANAALLKLVQSGDRGVWSCWSASCRRSTRKPPISCARWLPRRPRRITSRGHWIGAADSPTAETQLRPPTS